MHPKRRSMRQIMPIHAWKTIVRSTRTACFYGCNHVWQKGDAISPQPSRRSQTRLCEKQIHIFIFKSILLVRLSAVCRRKRSSARRRAKREGEEGRCERGREKDRQRKQPSATHEIRTQRFAIASVNSLLYARRMHSACHPNLVI